MLRGLDHWCVPDVIQNGLAGIGDGFNEDIRIAVVDHPVQLAPDHQNRCLNVGDGIAKFRFEAGIANSGKDDLVDLPVGDGALLQSFGVALAESRSPGSAALAGRAGSLHALATGVVSSVSADRLASERRLSFHAGQLEELRAQELAHGVDSDREMQNLLLIEQSFAANARVIETIDEMMTTLLRL